jgi:hypothetical protein
MGIHGCKGAQLSKERTKQPRQGKEKMPTNILLASSLASSQFSLLFQQQIFLVFILGPIPRIHEIVWQCFELVVTSTSLGGEYFRLVVAFG